MKSTLFRGEELGRIAGATRNATSVLTTVHSSCVFKAFNCKHYQFAIIIIPSGYYSSIKYFCRRKFVKQPMLTHMSAILKELASDFLMNVSNVSLFDKTDSTQTLPSAYQLDPLTLSSFWNAEVV